MLTIDDVDVTKVTCGGVNDGTITVIHSNGIVPYTYTLNGGAPQNSNVFTGVSAGVYTVEVVDGSRCSDFQNNVIINSNTTMTLDNIIPVETSCFGVADGGFEVFLTGGDPGVTYSSDGGASFQPSSVFTNLGATNYAVQVEDGNGCLLNGTVTIDQPAALTIDLISVTSNISCFGVSDGEVTVTASGGNGNYSYSL